MKQVLRVFVLAAISTMASGGWVCAATVRATNLHVHAGLDCVAKPGDAAKLAYNLAEGVRNSSTTASATVYCPVDIVRVMQEDVSSSGPVALRVFVIDRSSAGNITCTPKAIIENNGFDPGQSYPTKSSSGSFGSPQTLLWTGAELPAISNYTYRVSCTLPKAPDSSHQSAVVQTEVEVRSSLVVQ